mgnify:CR=1 FL=1
MQTLDALPRLGLRREDLFITSKVMCLPSTFNAPKHVTTPANQPHADALSDIATSRVGYLDLLLLWWPCSTLQQTVAAYRQLEPLVAAGKVRAWRRATRAWPLAAARTSACAGTQTCSAARAVAARHAAATGSASSTTRVEAFGNLASSTTRVEASPREDAA